MILLIEIPSLVILVPLTGALVRLRAHYNPKDLRLNQEGDVQPRTGPAITFFVMLSRVCKIEGWSGLYKGLMPALLSYPIDILLVLIHALGYSILRFTTFRNTLTDALGTLAYSLLAMLIFLPQTIIANRAITTPHKLPCFNAIRSLSILLTPTERRHPWTLYLTPGLVAARVLRTTYIFLRLEIVQRLPYFDLAQSDQFSTKDVLFRLAKFLVIVLASTGVLTPLEVIIVRLSVQKNHVAPDINLVKGSEDDAAQYIGIDEDVVNLRTQQEPYTGLADCARRIVDEEGWGALYRGWWLTMLGCLHVTLLSKVLLP